MEISIHAPHTGRDLTLLNVYKQWTDFNPRTPYGARQADRHLLLDDPDISIHAPHTGRDWLPHGVGAGGYAISIHAPHTGRDMKAIGV